MKAFNIEKCATLTITKNGKPGLHEIFDDATPQVEQYDYLSVMVSHDLRWNKHCQMIMHKASCTLGQLHRNFVSMLKGS